MIIWHKDTIKRAQRQINLQFCRARVSKRLRRRIKYTHLFNNVKENGSIYLFSFIFLDSLFSSVIPANVSNYLLFQNGHIFEEIGVARKAQPKAPLPKSTLRRKWGLAPLCGAVVTFSHYSKDPSRPRMGGTSLKT